MHPWRLFQKLFDLPNQPLSPTFGRFGDFFRKTFYEENKKLSILSYFSKNSRFGEIPIFSHGPIFLEKTFFVENLIAVILGVLRAFIDDYFITKKGRLIYLI